MSDVTGPPDEPPCSMGENHVWKLLQHSPLGNGNRRGIRGSIHGSIRRGSTRDSVEVAKEQNVCINCNMVHVRTCVTYLCDRQPVGEGSYETHSYKAATKPPPTEEPTGEEADR